MSLKINRGARRNRRQGMAVIYVAATLPFMMFMLSFAIDLGYLYFQKSEAQKAADSAALAGAFKLANFGSKDQADHEAKSMLSRGDNWRYQVVSGGNFTTPAKTTVILNYPVMERVGNTNVPHYNWYEVVVRRRHPAFFSAFLGFTDFEVSARAVAKYSKLAPMSINGLGTYGTAPGPVNLSVFGPNGNYQFGDCYSTRFLSGNTPNPLYTGRGYNFNVMVPFNFGSTTLEIFDPDCWNSGNQINAGGTDSNGNVLRIDEFRTKTGNSKSVNSTDATTTEYTFYWDNNTPGRLDDDVEVGTQSYGFTSSTDMKWNNAFTFNRTTYPTGNFRLNVTSTAGSSENGFDLRVGPTRTGSQQWNSNNGTEITADGHLPINFNQSGMVDMILGSVPSGVAGGQITVRKFDTDVGATDVTYSTPALPGMTWAGILSTGGAFATDYIQVPLQYNQDGVWKARYNAGLQDTSVWDMTYSGYVPGTPGSISLIY